VAQDFERRAAAIHGWVKQVEIDNGDHQNDLSSDEREELRHLRREVKQLHQKRDIPSKAAALFGTIRRDIAKAVNFKAANQADYSIQMMSGNLGVSRSGFYAHHGRPPND